MYQLFFLVLVCHVCDESFHLQLVDKDPHKAIYMFWAALNAGDRVDSALKDMSLVMKQVNRPDEAIEAIKSFRYLCSLESQESLDNILLELYKVNLHPAFYCIIHCPCAFFGFLFYCVVIRCSGCSNGVRNFPFFFFLN